MSKFTPCSEIYIKVKEPVVAKTILKNKNTVEGLILPHPKTYYEATDIKTAVLAWENIHGTQ